MVNVCSLSTFNTNSWAHLPRILLEEVFLYLSWKDRARAALTCKKWLSVFCSPSLWRVLTYHPTGKKLNRIQYDIKTHRLAKCINFIGWHLKDITFPKNRDFFILNRALSLFADFLEFYPPNCRKNIARKEFCLSDSSDEEETKPEPTVQSDDILNESEVPNEAATFALINKILEKEMLGEDTSSSDLEEFEKAISMKLYDEVKSHRFSMSFINPADDTMHISLKRKKYQRSQTCYVATFENPRTALKEQLNYPPVTDYYDPPYIKVFRLDFHCEIDEANGVTYGSGGRLLETIMRVIINLHGLRVFRLVDFYLTIQDARQLVVDLSKVSRNNLVELNLVQLYKNPFYEKVLGTNEPAAAGDNEEDNPDNNQADNNNEADSDMNTLPPYWYIEESRWLSARPKRFTWNPLCDIASMFPRLYKLELSVTQLTGCMLLRLVWQTNLNVLVFTRNDYSVIPIFHARGRPPSNSFIIENNQSDENSLSPFAPNMDWTGDVPLFNSFVENNKIREQPWEPIDNVFWLAAKKMRPSLKVHYKLQLSRWRSAELDMPPIMWPQTEVPLHALIIHMTCTVENDYFAQNILRDVQFREKNADCITTNFLKVSPQRRNSHSISPSANTDHLNKYSFTFLDNELIELIVPLVHVENLTIFGDAISVHGLTFLNLLRKRSQYQFSKVQMHRNVIRFHSPPDQNIFANTLWYREAIVGEDYQQYERLIAQLLSQPRWRFTHRLLESEMSENDLPEEMLEWN